MKPDILNLVLQAGATNVDTLVWSRRATATAPWVPVNITGYSARMQLKKRPGDVAVLTLHSGPGGGLTLDGPAGAIDYEIEFTPPLGDDGGYEFDLLMTAPSGAKDYIVRGSVTFEPGITDPV